jgi:hypothetical protein
MDVNYNEIWDDLPGSKGRPGLMYRSDANSQWMPHYPTEYDEKVQDFFGLQYYYYLLRRTK